MLNNFCNKHPQSRPGLQTIWMLAMQFHCFWFLKLHLRCQKRWPTYLLHEPGRCEVSRYMFFEQKNQTFCGVLKFKRLANYENRLFQSIFPLRTARNWQTSNSCTKALSHGKNSWPEACSSISATNNFSWFCRFDLKGPRWRAAPFQHQHQLSSIGKAFHLIWKLPIAKAHKGSPQALCGVFWTISSMHFAFKICNISCALQTPTNLQAFHQKVWTLVFSIWLWRANLDSTVGAGCSSTRPATCLSSVQLPGVLSRFFHYE